MKTKLSQTILKSSHYLGLSLGLLAFPACDGESSDTNQPRDAQLAPAKLVQHEAPAPDNEATQPAARSTLTQTPDSVEQILAGADAVKAARPALFSAIDELASQATPNGMPRFVSPQLQDADAGVIIAARILRDTNADSATRSALADALGRSAGDFGQMTVAILAQERDPAVRRTLTMSLRRASDAAAAAGLAIALADVDAQVRADAAYAAASHPDASALLAPLRAGLNDDDAVARAASARALGVLKDKASSDALLPLVQDQDAETRLQALRAIKRIDPALLESVDLNAMANDPDPRIAREAAKLSAK